MQVVLVLSVLIAAAFGGHIRSPDHHKSHFHQNVTDIIREQGYPVQNFTVETDDGYLLDVIRIPGSAQEKQAFEQQQRKDETYGEKPAVLLMHGLLSSAEDFVIGGRSEGLAFYLADQGFDVYMGNSRGNIYARKHTMLNPETDAAFWRFSWTDIGKKDLPAIIDKVLEISHQDKVHYIGHMQGTTAFYVMAATRTEYNNKIKMMVSLGPIAYMKETSNQMMVSISEHQGSKPWQMKNLGMNEFHPSTELLVNAGQQECTARGINERICQNPFFLINGYESNKLNMTTLQRYASRLPAGASTRQVLHYAQLMKSGRFEDYSENKPSEEFNLAQITMPVALIYAPEDKISAQSDVELLFQKLQGPKKMYKITEVSNNMDLLFANNVQRVVYGKVLDVLRQK